MTNKRALAQRKRRDAQYRAKQDDTKHHLLDTTNTGVEPLWILLDPDEAEDDLLPGPQALVDFINGNVANSSDEKQCDDNLIQKLFPIFTQPLQAKALEDIKSARNQFHILTSFPTS